MAATSATEKDALIAQFIGVTGADRERASFFLDSSGWKLQVAIDSFFDNPEDMEPGDPPVSQPPSGSSAGPPREEPAPPSVSWGGGASKGSSSSGRSSGRVATLGDYSSSKADGDSDDEGQAFYAGGPEHGSGQQVVGPKKKKKDGDLVQELFKQAKEHGAEEVGSGAPTTSQGRAGRGSAFRGAGYRLGELPSEPVVPVPGTAGTLPGPRPKERHIVLKLWKTGFSIDDGELRDYKSPGNDVFLRSVMKGEIPDELLRLAKGGEVSLDLEDHRNEDYVRPKQTIRAFAGQGMMLGSPAPTIVTDDSSSSSAQSSSSAAASMDIDASQPVTTLQLRLADGSRLAGKFNHTHTVGDIRNFIILSRPQYTGQAFNLLTTFPNKTLSDETQTISDAKLQNAVIVQRLT